MSAELFEQDGNGTIMNGLVLSVARGYLETGLVLLNLQQDHAYWTL